MATQAEKEKGKRSECFVDEKEFEQRAVSTAKSGSDDSVGRSWIHRADCMDFRMLVLSQ